MQNRSGKKILFFCIMASTFALASGFNFSSFNTEDPPKPSPMIQSDLYFDNYRYHPLDLPEELALNADFWIEVDLTNQMLYAYRGSQLINGFSVSTGAGEHKTITGTFKIYAKHPEIRMVGPGYDLDDVPYTLFFYKGYALHGTYWHSNFGTPMSHGCVNLKTEDADWIYQNAPAGAYVVIHY
jgi:hypothetical protein